MEQIWQKYVAAMDNNLNKDVTVGGPEVLSYNQIAKAAFDAIGKKKKITHLPLSVAHFVLFILRAFTNSKFYDTIEFLANMLKRGMVAPKYGEYTLADYYESLK